MGLTNSRGNRPSRLHCSMIGTRLSSIKRRAVSRTRRSSSVSRESNSMKSTPLNLKTGIFSSSHAGRARTELLHTLRQGRRSKLAEATGRVKPCACLVVVQFESSHLTIATEAWKTCFAESHAAAVKHNVITIEQAMGRIKRYRQLTTVRAAKQRANAHAVPRMSAKVAGGRPTTCHANIAANRYNTPTEK